MKTSITYMALSIGLRSVHLIKADDGLLILDSEGQSIARIVKGQKPRDALAKWICSLPADDQLDTLTAVRCAAQFMNPEWVSDKNVFELYPDTQIKI
jgi:hypothetical protein